MKGNIIHEDDNFTVSYDGEFTVSVPKNIPKGMFDFNLRSHHSDGMKDFESFRDRFVGVYEILKNKTDKAHFILCKKIKYINNISWSLDVRNKLSNEKVADLLLNDFETSKKEAIEEIEAIILKGDEKNVWDEQKIDELSKDFCLEEMYKEHMGSPIHTKRMDDLLKATDDLLQKVKEHNKNSGV
jgi:hypothetical protein